jgi:hypothetical protein
MQRGDVDREREFLFLLDQVEGRCSLEVARVLMKSFTSTPDFGTQERVVSVLASAVKSDAVTAMLEELPRMIVEAPEWAEVLIGQEVDRRPELLAKLARGSSADVQQSLQHLLADADFREFYPNANTLTI